MDFISAIQFLKLNKVSEAWVNQTWDTEFTERSPLDDVLEKELDEGEDEAFRTLYHCFLTYVPDQQNSTSIDGSSQSIWGILRENGVSIKALVAVLSFYVLGAKTRAANTQHRVNGLYAASVYLLLLKIPGSIANQVFHEVLLDTCSDLTSHCWPQDFAKKRKKEQIKSSKTEGKRAKPQRKKSPQMDIDEAEEEEDEEEDIYLSNEDLMKIREAAVFLVHSLLRLLQTFPLKDHPETASNFTQIFCQLLHFEPVLGEITFAAPRDVAEMKSIPEMAFYGLELLCSAKHGDQKESLRRVFHQLLFVILMMKKENHGKPGLRVLSQSVLAIRDYAIRFVCHLVEEQREQAKPFLDILLQHICFQIVEKSEYRSHGAQAVGMLTSQMENSDYCRFIRWLFNFSRQPKMVHRLFSVDVVMALLEQPERRLEECQDPELATLLPQKFLIEDVLFARRMDESPTVQGHALSCLAQCLELPSLNVTRAVHSLFCATGTRTVLASDLTGGPSCMQSNMKTLPFRTVEISSADSSGSEAATENLALLLRRVKDSKTNVRKAALQALLGLLKHDVIPPTRENLETLSERTRDPAVSVRKKALQCVGELLSAKAECKAVQEAWLQGVLPAVVDSESSMQEKALEALDKMLLSQIKLYSASHHMDANQRLTWDLLSLLSHECRNLSRYFSRAFAIWSKQDKFTPAFITNLMSHFKADHASGAWMLFSKVVTSSPKFPCGKILDSWDTLIRSRDVDVTTFGHILSVMGDIAVHLNDDTKNRIVVDVMSLLKSFTLSLELISAAVQTLYQLGSQENIKQTQAFLDVHCGELLPICEAYLSAVILNENAAQDFDEELMIKHLHTLGVASLQCPSKVTKKMVLLVESVLTEDSNKLADCQDDVPPSLPLSQFKVNSFPPRIKAHGVLTFGKLCLQREELVHKYMPVFARELEVSKEVAVRNNVVVVMCDLCVRYTNIVDHYIPDISACLRDEDAVIRGQTLTMLTNLLQEEFVKWKGSLFFRFMMALVDPVPSVASLCEYCLLHLLLKKNPEMFRQHFIECIFHFNSYNKHESYNKFPQTEREKVRFSLKGAQHREKRFRIYRFLLEHFTDAQRLATSNKINQTVLAYFADEELPLDADGSEILSETFTILSLKEMKLQATSAGCAAGEEAEEENMARAVLQATQKKVMSQVQKKAFIENTIPLVISLKNLLEQRRSPVLKDLMAYLQVMMQEYRNEVKEIFSGDEQLAAEVEFALKTMEKEEEMQAQMENCTLREEKAKPPVAQGSVPSSPLKQGRVLAFNFTTPQPPRPHPQMVRRPVTDSRVCRSRPEAPNGLKSFALEGTGRLSEALKDRAYSTPKGTNIQITFNENFSAIYSDQGSPASGEASVLHMRPAEQKDGGPELWNVQSPLRQKKRSSKV